MSAQYKDLDLADAAIALDLLCVDHAPMWRDLHCAAIMLPLLEKQRALVGRRLAQSLPQFLPAAAPRPTRAALITEQDRCGRILLQMLAWAQEGLNPRPAAQAAAAVLSDALQVSTFVQPRRTSERIARAAALRTALPALEPHVRAMPVFDGVTFEAVLHRWLAQSDALRAERLNEPLPAAGEAERLAVSSLLSRVRDTLELEVEATGRADDDLVARLFRPIDKMVEEAAERTRRAVKAAAQAAAESDDDEDEGEDQGEGEAGEAGDDLETEPADSSDAPTDLDDDEARDAS